MEIKIKTERLGQEGDTMDSILEFMRADDLEDAPSSAMDHVAMRTPDGEVYFLNPSEVIRTLRVLSDPS